MNKIKKASKPDTKPEKAKGKKIKQSRRKTLKPNIKSGRIKGDKKAKMPKIRIKYSEKSRFTKFVSKSQLQKHIIDGKFVFSKAMTKQYNTLKHRFGLSELEYLKLYYGVRKANAKGRRLAKEDSLYHVKYSTKFKGVMDRYDYKVLMESIGRVLSPDYKKRKNEEFKKRFMQNIEMILSDKAARNINELINEMTASELKQFIDENPDLEKVMYESDPEKFTTFDKEATSLIENRLREFLHKGYKDIETEYDVASASELIK